MFPTIMRSIPQPGRRLITQNLVGSADFALHGPNPNWASVQDLATLVDVFCMYDEAAVLGRQFNEHLGSTIGEVLTSSNFITVENPAEELESVTEAAKSHILAFIGTEKGSGSNSARVDELLKLGLSLNENQCRYGLSFLPDGREDMELGELWLKAERSGATSAGASGWERGAMYVIRSFLYAAYSDVTGLVLVPDSVRYGILEKFISGERQLRDKLLEKMADTGEVTDIVKDTRLQRSSALAAVVFERAAPDRTRIPAEMDLLRAELAPIRRRLRTAEDKIFFGKGAEVADAKNEWDLVVDELERRFGKEPHLISVDGILRFGRDLGDIVDNSSKPNAWLAALLGLPFDILRRVVARRRAIELHRLHREIPGSGRLLKNVLQLFGSVIEQQPQ